MPNLPTNTSKPGPEYRIGAVSGLSGVPIPTLRVWEIRYATFRPRVTAGRQRLYSDDDVLRATLLRRLTEQGHAIRSIAQHSAAELHALLQQHQSALQKQPAAPTAQPHAHAVVVGLTLAARLASPKFKNAFGEHTLDVTHVWADLDTALEAPLTTQPQFLLAHINSLHPLVLVGLHRLMDRCQFPHTVVLYRFGQEQLVQSLKLAGIVVRREPVAADDLADLLRASLRMDPPRAMGHNVPAPLIPARKYDDATLAQLASTPSQVLCECPRHVAEILTQLASFEQYSQECLNRSAEDAQLHAYLHSVAGSTRAMFEQALQRLVEHDGLVPPTVS